MRKPAILNNQSAVNAICIGGLCSVSYLAVYFARNIFGAVSPKMIEDGFTENFIGNASLVYMLCYGVGQLINGRIGDKVKARYMISLGLLFSGIMNFVFAQAASVSPAAANAMYGMSGYFLAMIYGSITKVVAENTELVYATRCSLGYTFASFFGSPMAGIAAASLPWQGVFLTASAALVVMAVICFLVFILYERKGIVKYGQFQALKEERGGSIKLLLERQIIKFTLIAFLTGIVRTTVVFWMPTYISQYLGFSADAAAGIFTVATFVISATAFIAIFVYEKLKRNMDKTILIMFVSAVILFGLTYLVRHPALNILFLVAAIMSSNSSAAMMYSRYCPGLRDTGMVSSVTGYIDFVSYFSAALATKLFANAAVTIGWGKLILVWCLLMVVGVIVSLPYKRKTLRS